MQSRLVVVAVLLLAPTLPAQSPRALTAGDYARAERLMGYNTTALVSGAAVSPTWLPDDRFWYRNAIREGTEFIVVDPVRKTRARAFDHARLAAALARAADTTVDPMRLPFTRIELSADLSTVTVEVRRRRWNCDTAGAACTPADSATELGRGRSSSWWIRCGRPEPAPSTTLGWPQRWPGQPTPRWTRCGFPSPGSSSRPISLRSPSRSAAAAGTATPRERPARRRIRPPRPATRSPHRTGSVPSSSATTTSG